MNEHVLNAIITTQVRVSVNGSKARYINLGYKVETDEIGKHFKVKPVDLSKGSHIEVEMQCAECGVIKTYMWKTLVNKKTPYCITCSNKLMDHTTFAEKNESVIGKKYNKLTITKELEKIKGVRRVEAICECGGVVQTAFQNIRNGNTKSCGCLNKETVNIQLNERMLNKRFGHLVVIEQYEERTKHGEIYWKCLCDCGNYAKVTTGHLNFGDSISCGQCDIKAQTFAKSFIGKTFGRLTIIELGTRKDANGSFYVICRCTCGTIKEIMLTSILNGHTKSCGCLQKELASKILEEYNRLKGYRIRADFTEEENIEYDAENNINNFYSSKEWRDIRKKVLIRDSFKCKVTGRTDDLVVHHIFLRKDYPELALDINNLITLNRSVHATYHGTVDEVTDSTFLMWLRSIE